jgi:hypothetical protein
VKTSGRLIKHARPDKACTVRLVAPGGEPSDPPALCRDAGQDSGVASAGGIARRGGSFENGGGAQKARGEVSSYGQAAGGPDRVLVHARSRICLSAGWSLRDDKGCQRLFYGLDLLDTASARGLKRKFRLNVYDRDISNVYDTPRPLASVTK